jgi:ubiquinone/menaquinone biosynthesis C-methylase UbiE
MATGEIKKLNLGCGENYREGWVNTEVLKKLKADKYFDLNSLPYPFESSSFDEVLMKMVLEHLNDPIKVLKELVRITKNEGKITIMVPHASSYANLTDIQHKTNFTENSFNLNCLREYDLEELELIMSEFSYPNNKWKRFVPFRRYLKIYLNGIYDDITFYFKVKKNSKK